MEAKVILIRHAEVDRVWKPLCYGQMDVQLSPEGILASDNLARKLTSLGQPSAIYHSNLIRTCYLAEELARLWNGDVPVFDDARLRERDYGDWEGMTWDAVFSNDPEHFHELIDRPDTYRPPGGETTTEMQQRILSWFKGLSRSQVNGPIIAVSHSGPIAALCGALLAVPANQWEPWTIGCLDSIHIDQDDQLSRHSP
jgi:broad specificity phosphatase PhoE